MRNSIFWPLLAQVLIVAAVGLRVFIARVTEIRGRRLSPQSMSDSRNAAENLRDITAADNFRNLFEVPVLFFAICCVLAITDNVTPLQIGLAWLYVALRVVHSLIHLTYNRVTHRSGVFITSTLCVFLMWGLFAVALWQSG